VLRKVRQALRRAVGKVLSYSPFVARGGDERREVALTFDDGPGPYTPKVLIALNRLHVKATFFVIG
jgi:peptidoglycan/xylan/chitin deacetylase (PgdA/CDA1 family)